jgi:hypothetical protein
MHIALFQHQAVWPSKKTSVHPSVDEKKKLRLEARANDAGHGTRVARRFLIFLVGLEFLVC